MKSNIESLSGFEKKLNVQVSAQEVNEEFNKVFKYLQKNVENRGFRKGRTPMGIIRRLYADKVKEDVIRGLVENFYPKAVEEQNVVPVEHPRLDYKNLDLEENKDFSFVASFETYPEIENLQIDSLEVEKEDTSSNYDSLVENEIKNLLDNHSKMEEVVLIRELKEGDFANIDFDFYRDGQFLEDQSTEGYLLEIGSRTSIPGFEEGLVGMKKGETKFLEIRLPDTYHEESLRGVLAKIKVTLNEIKKKIQPELNDEFVKEFTDSETLEELKSKLKQQIIELEEEKSEKKLKDQIFEALFEANPVEIPKALLERKYSTITDNLKKDMKLFGKSQDEISMAVDKEKDRISKDALFFVRRDIFVRKIVDEYNLKPTEKELEDYLIERSKNNSMDLEKLKKQFIRSKKDRPFLKSVVEEKKVFQFLLGRARITVVNKDKISSVKEVGPEKV